MNVLLSVLLAAVLANQTGSPKAPSPEPQAPGAPTPASLASPNSAYVIGPQDQLSITVFDEADLTNKYRVDSEGMISFPLIGRVAASGLTLRILEERLTQRLSSGFLKNPQVRVEIDQFKSQSVYVSGEVRQPNKYSMSGTMTLIEALAMAGSPTAAASGELIVIRPKKPTSGATLPGEDADAEQTRINIRELQLGKAGQNITLQDGDTIFVPKAETIYITGQVKNAGSYVYEAGMTVLQAISLAGGLSEKGSDRRITVLRIVKGKQQTVTVKMTDLVKPNDTIQVPQRFF